MTFCLKKLDPVSGESFQCTSPCSAPRLTMLSSVPSSAFFVTFWQMTLYDLHYPKERYDAEVSRLKGLQREAATNTSLQAADRDSFIAKIIDLATKLMAEMGRHFSASRGATRRLEKEKDHWFESTSSPFHSLTMSRSASPR